MRRNLRRKRRKRLAPYGRSPIPPRRRRRGPMPPCGFARRPSISSSTRRRKCCTGSRGSARRSEPCRRTRRPSSKRRSTACGGRRAIRDLAHRLGKEVELEVQGGAVELDRTVIEALADPLTHLVRNAVDHGLETSAQRISMGKSVRGLLVLSARRERDKVLVEVSDDGAGFDGERLRQRAIELGALSPEKLPD